MVDTIKCQSELDLTEPFFEKLLLGAIDKRMDRKKIEAHNPVRHDQDTIHAMPYRSKAPGTDKERQWSSDDYPVGSSGRGTSGHPNRHSTMRTLVESPIDARQTAQTFHEGPSNMTSSRHASPPSGEYGRPRRPTTFSSAIQEAEEPEPRAAQRSSTFGSHQSHWWTRNGS